MERSTYFKIGFVVVIFLVANLIPTDLTAGKSMDLSINFYPNPPYNTSYLNTDTTLTLQVQNDGDKSGKFTYWISDRSENLYLNGRDGVELPVEIEIGEKENYYQSFALLPLIANGDRYYLEMSFSKENEFLCSRTFDLEIFRPNLNMEDLKSIISEDDYLSSESEFYLIPRYRRYWHPKRSEMGRSNPSYLWLVVDSDSNDVLDDRSGRIIYRDVSLPWKIDSPEIGSAKLWNGIGFAKRRIPTVKVEGDTTYNLERFELYFAFRDNNPAWVSRRIMYWTEENVERGSFNEIPDTERVEYWTSVENGEPLFTISDYHHYSFRYDSVESYTIQDFYHCPLPKGHPLLWFDFTLGDYKVYPLSDVKTDHIGFSDRIHPVDRVFGEKMPLIKRNLFAVGLSVLVFLIPIIWSRFSEKNLDKS